MKSQLDRFSLLEAEKLSPEDKQRFGKIPIMRADEWATYLDRAVSRGEAHLTNVLFNGENVGSIAWRIETDVERELVIMSAASNRADLSISAFLPQAVDQIAAQHKCDSARFHTCRPSLVRLAHRAGWQTTEIVVTKNYHV